MVSPEPGASGRPASIRAAYEEFGAREFYAAHGEGYRNPHEERIGRLLARVVPGYGLDVSRVLDLACGSGEVTLALRGLGAGVVEGVDPFTGAAYLGRTGRAALPLGFEDVAAGALAGRSYSLVVCSFALHLAEESRLPGVVWALAEVSDALVVVTPHKRPVLRDGWGWRLVGEELLERVRARVYRSAAAAGGPG